MAAESVCYCEVDNVIHSDVFSSSFGILPKTIRKGKSCKEVQSKSVNLRKCTSTNQYFLQFSGKKNHDHELPPPGTCLIISEEQKEMTRFKLYRVSRNISASLPPLLSLSVGNAYSKEMEKSLRTNLKVSSYPVSDFEVKTPHSFTELCLLHVTRHYICATKESSKNNLELIFISAICDKTVCNVQNNANDSLPLKITLHNPENTLELEFKTRLRESLLDRMKDYLKMICSNDDRNNTVANCDELPAGEQEADEQVSDPSSLPKRVEKANTICPKSMILTEYIPESKAPPCRRDIKPSTLVVNKKEKQRTFCPVDNDAGVYIHYENVRRAKAYENVQIQSNKEPLNLSVSIFATEPILTELWLLEIIFLRSEDIGRTFKIVENSQKMSGRHSVVSCRPIKAVTGMVLLLDIKTPDFQLLSCEKHISYDKLGEISADSWLVVEEQIKYNGRTNDEIQFWSTLKLVSSVDQVNEEITILDKFKGSNKDVSWMKSTPQSTREIHGGCDQVSPRAQDLPTSVTFPLTYAARLKFCQLLDMDHVFGKDWKLFASLMKFEQHEIRVIEGKRDKSFTENILRHLETLSPSLCNYERVVSVLKEMGRPDLIDLLVSCNEGAVENEE